MPHSGTLPAYFVPDYQALPLPEALTAYAPEQIYSGRRAFVPCDSLWTFQLPTEAQAPLAAIKSKLETVGFNVDRFETNPDALPGMRLKSPDRTEVMEIWKISPEDSLRAHSEKDTYAVHYYQRFGEEDIRKVLDQLLEEGGSMDMMARLRWHWADRHREAFLQSLDEDKALHSTATLATALQTLQSMGETAAALKLLPLAYLYDRASGNKHANRIEKVGQELFDDPAWKPSFPSEEELASLGIPTLDFAGSEFPRSLRLGSVMLYKTAYPDGERLLRYIWIANPTTGPEGKIQFTIHKGSVGPHSHSWGSRVESLPYTFGADFVGTAAGAKAHQHLVVHKVTGAEEQFEVSLEQSSPKGNSCNESENRRIALEWGQKNMTERSVGDVAKIGPYLHPEENS